MTSEFEFVGFSKQQEITCKHLGKWGVYVNGSDAFDTSKDTEITKRLNELNKKYGPMFFAMLVINGEMALFDTQEEAMSVYMDFDTPPLSDSSVYACIISPVDGCVTENT